MNCKGCKNLAVNNFTCIHYCIKSGSECTILRPSDLASPIVPKSNECPGYSSPWE